MGWQDRAYNQDRDGGVPPVVFSMPKISRLTMALIGACLVVFLVQAFTRSAGNPLTWWGSLTLIDGAAFTQPWRWVTYQYLHGGGVHFFFNMIGLFFFLPALEALWGWKKALAFYTLGGIAGGLLFVILGLIVPGGESTRLIGASGSVLALLGACALLFPHRQLILLIFPVPIRVAAALFGALFLLTTVADQDFSNAAHLGGLAFGFFAPWLAGPYLRKQTRRFDQWRDARAERQAADEVASVDRILEKVARTGMNSLTSGERRALARATKNQQQREAGKRGVKARRHVGRD